MFVPNSNQCSLFDITFALNPKKLKDLKESWAGAFREEIMPILIDAEQEFASLYSPDRGAPIKYVSIIMGLLILKEMNDLTDKQLLERYKFDILFHYALGVTFDEALLAERTVFYFRKRLTENEMAQDAFTSIVDRIIERWDIKTKKHRLDSTVIMSNMKNLNRLELFIRTIESFLKDLRKNKKASYKALGRSLKERYMDREGYFAYPKPSEAKRKLEQCAADVCFLVNRFRGSGKVQILETYQKLERLMNEQIEVSEGENGRIIAWYREPEKKDDDSGGTTLKPNESISGEVLQNPSDPDATYSGHKGTGYKVHASETCDEENPFQVIDYASVDKANASDHKATEQIHEELNKRGHAPETTYADAGYTSGENMANSKDADIDLKGPVPGRGTSKEKVLDQFRFDEEYKQVESCPGGHKPVEQSCDDETLEAKFDEKKCASCPFNKECPVNKQGAFRVLKIKRDKAAIIRRRQEQETKEFKEEYKIRSGIEATFSHLKNDRGMRRLRVRGSPSVTLTVIFKIMGENVSRALKYVQETMKKPLKEEKPARA